MGAGALRRKVLVLRDQPSIRNLLYFLQEFEHESAVAEASDASLGSLGGKPFDAVVLDLRPPGRMTRDEVRAIRMIRAGWVGKLLVIIAEVNGAKTRGLLERYIFDGFPEVPRRLFSQFNQSQD